MILLEYKSARNSLTNRIMFTTGNVLFKVIHITDSKRFLWCAIDILSFRDSCKLNLKAIHKWINYGILKEIEDSI